MKGGIPAEVCVWSRRPQVASCARAAGYDVDDDAWLVLADGMPEDDGLKSVIVLADDRNAALAAVRAGAVDALVWPDEADRLEQCLIAARRQAKDRVGCSVYREVFRANPVWMELTDEEVRLLDVSKGFVQGSGYPREHAVGQTPAALFRGGTHKASFYESMLATLEATGRWSGDTLGRRSDGSLAVLETHLGRLTIGDRVVAQYAVKLAAGGAAPDTLRGWVEGHVSAPWLVVHRSDGTIVEAGQEAHGVFGVARSTLIGEALPTLGLGLMLPAPGEQRVEDVWLDGRAFEVRLEGRQVGDASLVLVVLHDITERRRREEELNALAHDLAVARDQALAADQAKSAFLAGMSHELRTPLTAILGYAELLSDELFDPGAVGDLARITTAGRHLLGLVDDILDLARVESGEVQLHVETFFVRELLEEVAHSLRLRAATAGQRVVVDCSPSLQMTADRQRVQQVVLNLAGNAVKYAVPGRVTLGATRGRIHVEDEGPGLSLTQQRRMFHAFRQLHDVGDGVGLGMAISRRLAEALGGVLRVASSPGSGSRFTLDLLSEVCGAEGDDTAHARRVHGPAELLETGS